jgi:hypothetical protein
MRDYYNRSRQLREVQIAQEAFEHLARLLRPEKRTHQQKRKLVSTRLVLCSCRLIVSIELQDLGLMMKPYSARSLLAIPQKDRPFQIRMVLRGPFDPLVQRHTFFTDSQDPDSPYHYVGEEAGYYRVHPSESVIFYSKSSDENEGML